MDVASGDFTYTLRVKDEDYDSVLKNGFIFREQHLIKQPGAYQIRLVMRDATTQKLGSASQYLDVPDVKKGHLAVSGILLSQSSDLAASTGALANNQTQAFDAKGNAAVRIFRPGAKIAYVYGVLNTQHPPGNRRRYSSKFGSFAMASNSMQTPPRRWISTARPTFFI